MPNAIQKALEALEELTNNRHEDYLHPDDRKMLKDAAGQLRDEHCTGCGRLSEDCSADPCEDVIRDRGEDDYEGEDTPLDTPSLDTSFHDHEMNID